MVGSRFGLKAGFLRNSEGNFGYYYEYDPLRNVDDPANVDPDTSLAPFPGCTIVTLGDGRKGIHTNGQWLQMSKTFDQQVVFVDEFGVPFDEPPTNPAYAASSPLASARPSPHRAPCGSMTLSSRRVAKNASRTSMATARSACRTSSHS